MAFQKIKVHEETVTIKRTTQYIEIDMDFTQIYDSFYSLTFGLKSTKSFQLLFYMLKNVADNNLVVNVSLYNSFNNELMQHEGKGITERTFYNCIKELEVAKILSKKDRGYYFINPHVLWKEDKNKRLDFIKSDPLDNNKIAFNPIKLLPAPKDE